MNVARALALFGYKAAFKTMGIDAAGKALVDALSSPEENVRTIAAMFLVQSGDRAVPLLRAALARGKNVPTILAMLADIGDPRARSDIEAYLRSADPVVAESARDALNVLEVSQLRRQ